MLSVTLEGYKFTCWGSTFIIEPSQGQWLVSHTELDGFKFLVSGQTALYNIARQCEEMGKAIVESSLKLEVVMF